MSQRTALVTGASGGIGSAVAKALAQRGDRVLLAGRSRARLDAVTAAIGQGAEALAVDLAVPGAALALGGKLAERLERLDVFVHAAGQLSSRAGMAGAAGAFEEEQREAELRTHLMAPQALVHALGPALQAARGDVVLIASSIVRHPRAGFGPYAASKAGLVAWADCLRAEVNTSGVRVLTILPGRTATPMQAELLTAEGRPEIMDQLLQPEEVAATILHAIELPRSAEITELHIRPARPHWSPPAGPSRGPDSNLGAAE